MYHYRDGGLENVWLANGYRKVSTPYGEGVSINDVDGLTRTLCMMLAKKQGLLSGKEFRYLRMAGLELSQAALGHEIGKTEQSIARWEKSKAVPKYADKLIRVLYVAHADGNATVRKLIERIRDVDRLLNQRVVLEETRRGWKAEQTPA